MNRRSFLVVSSLGAANALVGCATPGSVGRRSVYRRLIAQNDAAVTSLLERQQLDPSHPARGGVPDRHGIHHAGSASGLIRACAVAWVSEESRFFHSPELIERMRLAVAFLLGVQNDDGTIDLLTTNFHSTPDTGFVMEWMCLATAILRDAARPEPGPLLAELDRFVLRAAEALTVGGIHTPNHRWVVCMGLARANRLHPDPRYVARIDEWLGEGIDIDADGQFTERSTSVYSPLTDRCLITVARLLDRPALLEPVRRNLEMTLFYLHADGEVVTEGSRRQDQYKVGSLSPYTTLYRYMAQRDGNGRFAAAARWIESMAMPRLTRDAVFFAESEALRGRMPASAALPKDRYEKHYRHSGLVRIRRGSKSATVLEDNPTFFSLHSGSAAVAVRFAFAFFGKGQFVGENLRKEGRSWVMDQELSGPYWQPLAAKRRTGVNDWAKTDRTSRQASEVQRLLTTVRVTETDGVFELGISIQGTDRVPVAIELGFKGGELSGHGLLKMSGQADAWLLAAGTGRFESGADAIGFRPGQRAHAWTALRGALPKLDADCVYLTGFTPFRTTLRFD